MAEEVGRAIMGDEKETPFYKKPENIITGLVLAAALAQPRQPGMNAGQTALQRAAGALQFRGALGQTLEDRRTTEEQRITENEQKQTALETQRTQAETQRAGVEVNREGVGVDRRQVAEQERHNKAMEQLEMSKARLVAATKLGSDESLTRALGDLAVKNIEASNKVMENFQLQAQGVQDPVQLKQLQTDMQQALARNASVFAAQSNALRQMIAHPEVPFVVTTDANGMTQLVPMVDTPMPETPSPAAPVTPPAETPKPEKAPLDLAGAEAAVTETRATEARKKEEGVATERRIAVTARDLAKRSMEDLIALQKQKLQPELKEAVARAIRQKQGGKGGRPSGD